MLTIKCPNCKKEFYLKNKVSVIICRCGELVYTKENKMKKHGN